MKNSLKYAVLMFLLFTTSFQMKQEENYPSSVISNGILRAELYHPDAEKGFYRGSRFDWSGVISSLEYKEHQYFGKWYAKHNPVFHDAITGPVEEFLPLDFDTVKTGGSFVKVGIGVMIRPDEKKYSFVTPYKLINPGSWHVKPGRSSVSYTHTLNDNGYGYTYTKTVELVKGKPEMVLSHTLRNTGKRLIETDVYNHNFFVIDQQPTGPDFTVRFPYPVAGEGRGHGVAGTIVDNTIRYLKTLQKGENLFYPSLSGPGTGPEGYDISIENSKTKAGVRITGDRPLSKLVYWSAPTTVCPEPYIHVKASPGETFTWKIRYRFYEVGQ